VLVLNKLFVVGIGPGKYEKMTIEAAEVLKNCDVIAGYSVYTELVKPYYPDKEYIVNGMRQERERCRLALQAAQSGKTTAVVCSGDSGVYGMASLILELSVDFTDVEIEVVSGVTAALSGSAVLGSPLGHDFAVISLSDLMTPWQKIEDRLKYAAVADLVICLYNPSSKKRSDYLQKACDIILNSQKAETVCGIVKNIGREGEIFEIMTLGDLRNTKVDMFTTVFVGNSQTKVINGRMVTPRGYFA
jgi:precorrin-3B C17-methyltransferase